MMSEWFRIFVVTVVVFWAFSQLFIGCILTTVNPSIRVGLVGIGLCAIVVATDRDTYLPFLGRAALPSSVLQISEVIPGDVVVDIDGLPSRSKLIWWTSKRDGGVVDIGEDGRAKIFIDCPAREIIGKRRMLPSHLNYRFVESEGILSSVRTKQLNACSKNWPVNYKHIQSMLL